MRSVSVSHCVFEWARRGTVAAAIMFWALGVLVSAASVDHPVQPGFARTHICEPLGDASGDPGQTPHHHCFSCVLCDIRELAQSIIEPGAASIDFTRRNAAIADWASRDDVAPRSSALIARRARGPPSYS